MRILIAGVDENGPGLCGRALVTPESRLLTT
jgi:hypothetical protein